MSPWLADALLRSQTDERLIALAREGRERAFTTLVERYRKPLLAFAGGLAGPQRAEDVVQQALLQAWSALMGGADVRHASGWLHQIVRHAAVKARARVSDDALPDELPGGADPAAALEQRMAADELLVALRALPERQREAIMQTALEGRSREEVAGRLGLSEGAVRQLVHRARTSLRAAATAMTPLPLIQWASSRPIAADSGMLSERLGDIVAGVGSAGASGALIKAGAIVLATGAVAGGVVESRHHASRMDGSAPAATSERSRAGAATGGPGPSGSTGSAGDPAGSGSGSGGETEGHGGSPGHGHGGSGRGGHSGSGGGPSESSGPGSSGQDSSGSGSSGPGSSSSGSSGSGSGGSDSGGSGSSGSGSSGSGSSGSGSGSSGSGSSGSGSSGSSGSGSSGSGSSGSGSGDTSGSGSSGSGSSGSGSSGSGSGGSGSSGSGSDPVPGDD